MEFFLFLFTMTPALVMSQSTTHFINPPDEQYPDQDPSLNYVYHVGDIFNIAWSTPEEVITLIINQQNSSLTQIDYLPNSRGLTRSSYSWKVTIDGSDDGSKFDLALDNQFNFLIFKTNGTEPLALSAFFNITNATVDQYGRTIPSAVSATPSSATLLLPSTTSAIGSVTPSLPPGVSPTTKSMLMAPVSESSSKTNKGITGAVLGVLGILGLVIGFGVWFFRGRSRVRREKIEAVCVLKHASTQYHELREDRPEIWKPLPEIHAASIPDIAELPS